MRYECKYVDVTNSNIPSCALTPRLFEIVDSSNRPLTSSGGQGSPTRIPQKDKSMWRVVSLSDSEIGVIGVMHAILNAPSSAEPPASSCTNEEVGDMQCSGAVDGILENGHEHIPGGVTNTDLHVQTIRYKSGNSGWISSAKSLDREYFLLMEGANVSFTKTHEECARFAEIHFNSIFMM